MTTILLIFSLLCLVAIVIGLFTPEYRMIAIVAGSVLLYLPSLFVWWCILYFHYVDIGKLIAPYRWTEYEEIAYKLWGLVPPLIPSVILLLFCIGKYRHRRRQT